MALVFRTDQSTPLTNDQVDNNFKYLRDQNTLKYNTSDFTAANISAELNTATEMQTTLDLAQANALNAWTVRNLAPTSILPSDVDKSSLVSRNSSGDITVGTVNGALSGNATTATLAANATKLLNARSINGVSFDGTADINVVDSSKLPLAGGTLTGKLILPASQSVTASINFGSSSTAPSNSYISNGDMWATTSGFFYRMNDQTDQFAMIASPSFIGIPKVPGFSGEASQIVAFSHLDAAKSDINTAIALKAPIASPTFTGTPIVPTATAGNNTNQIATTSFVQTAVTSKANDLTASYQSYTDNSIVNQSNAFNVLLAAKAALASPTFTGTPSAPTASAGNSSTQLATTAFVSSAANTLQNTLNAAVSALQDLINSTRPVPLGVVMYMPTSAVPYGFFEANGQAVSRTTYAALWQFLGSPNTGDGSTTFNIPDYRGEFIRGWDHGRGVDTNRALGTVQYSQNLAHNHGMPGDDQLDAARGTAAWDGTSRGSFGYDANSHYGGGAQVWNTTTDGGNESRPRNIALMPIIKW